jgi:hypothetical protein
MVGAVGRATRRAKREQRAQANATAARLLLSLGHTCATCEHIGRAPLGSKGSICELDSDSEGHVIVDRAGVCTRHKERTTPA